MRDKKTKGELGSVQDMAAKIIDDKVLSEDRVASAMNKTTEYSNDDLSLELEQLALTFKNEYEKAKNMTPDELEQNGFSEENSIPEEDLCQCCGERVKDRSYGQNHEYCDVCTEAMRRYPFSIPTIILAVAVVFVAVVSVLNFAVDYKIYENVKQGDEYYSQGKLYSAYYEYNDATTALKEQNSVSKTASLKMVDILYHTMPQGVSSMSQLVTLIDSTLTPAELNMPIYKEYADMRTKSLIIYGTLQKVYAVTENEEYADFDGKDEKVYEAMASELEDILGEKVSVISADGETTQKANCSEAAVRWYQSMLAYSLGKNDEFYGYMNRVAELEPDLLWLYAYQLGSVELQLGNIDKATEYANKLYKNNLDSADAYELYSSIYRMQNQPDKAIQWAKDGIAIEPNFPDFYRALAMAYVVKGDYDSAKEAVDTALQIDQYVNAYETAIVIENELGNDDKVEEYKKAIKDMDAKLSDKMKSYLKGEISAKDMFTKGTGEVE